MSLNTDQKTSRLDKKSLGLGETNENKAFFEESYQGRPKVYPDQIWTEKDLIPETAPNTLAHLEIDGVVQRVIDLTLTAVPGTTNAFFSEYLKDVIDFNFGDGSYNYAIKDDLDNPIVPGQGDWRIDTEAGLLTFYGTVPANMPPKVSVYRYVGVKALFPIPLGEEVDKDLYIDVNGNDLTGDGSQGNPFQTFAGAFKSLKQDLTNAKINIYLGAGTFNMTPYEQTLLTYFQINKNINVYGTLSVLRDDFLAQTLHPTDSFRRMAVSNPGGTPMNWGVNEYSGKVARLSNYAPDYSYSVIGPHDADNLMFPLSVSGWYADAVMNMDTTVHIADGNYFAGIHLSGKSNFNLNFCNITTDSGKAFNFKNSSKTGLQMLGCNIVVADGKTFQMNGNVGVGNSRISTNVGTNVGVRINETADDAAISQTTFQDRDPATALAPALRLESSKAKTHMLYYYGYAYGIELYEGTHAYMYYGHYPVGMRRIGACFNLKGSSRFTLGEWYGQHKFYLNEDVGYMFALQGGVNNLNFIFNSGVLNGSLVHGLFVPAAGGEYEGQPTVLTALRDKPEGGYINPGTNNRFYLPGYLYAEYEQEQTQTAPNNDSVTFGVGHQSQNRTIVLKGHLERDGVYQSCDVVVVNNGGGSFDVEPNQVPYKAAFEAMGFSAALNGDVIELTMTADDNVNPVNYTFTIERKMI